MLYIDFQKQNNTNNNIPASAEIAIDTRYKDIRYKYISLSKLDIDTSNLFFMRCPLKSNQQYYNSSSKYLNKYSQDDGFYETKFSFIYYDTAHPTGEVIPFYYKSTEQQLHAVNFKSEISTPQNRTYNNFDPFFEVKNFNNFLGNLNDNIKHYLINNCGWSQTEADVLAPVFYTKDNVLYFNCLSDEQDNSADYIMVDDPTKIQSDNKKFCIGFSTNLSKLLLRPILKKTINNYDFVVFNSTGFSSYFEIILNQVKYKFLSFTNSDYFEYANDIRQLIISTNLSVQPLYNNIKQPEYELDNNYYQATISESILYKLQIDHNKESINRLIYSNNSITNNYSILNSINNNYFQIYISFVDKYNNIVQYQLPPQDNIYVQLAVWTDEPLDGFFGRKRGFSQIDNNIRPH